MYTIEKLKFGEMLYGRTCWDVHWQIFCRYIPHFSLGPSTFFMLPTLLFENILKINVRSIHSFRRADWVLCFLFNTNFLRMRNFVVILRWQQIENKKETLFSKFYFWGKLGLRQYTCHGKIYIYGNSVKLYHLSQTFSQHKTECLLFKVVALFVHWHSRDELVEEVYTGRCP